MSPPSFKPDGPYVFKLRSYDPAEDPYVYQSGFGNYFTSEAVPGAVPQGINNPQNGPFGLIPEQITGTAFVTARSEHWFHRIRPSVAHDGTMRRMEDHPYQSYVSDFSSANPDTVVQPEQASWEPYPIPTEPTDFFQGIKTQMGAGDPRMRNGVAIHVYGANTSMERRAFCNNDGDYCIMVQQGRLDIQTEFGRMMVFPGELCVIQRGMRVKIGLPDGPSRGFIQEIFNGHYKLPDLGPLGGSGLAQIRDFQTPTAHYEEDEGGWEIHYKVLGKFFKITQDHSPFDVVGWYGNYVPYKYDIQKFRYIGSVKVDHLDPSIFCILTTESHLHGQPLCDVLAMSTRWDVASQTFRPPYFHRNTSSEFVGCLKGRFGGKDDFVLAGGASFDCGFTPHGMEVAVFNGASQQVLEPHILFEDVTIFMFETAPTLVFTPWAVKSQERRYAQASWKTIDHKWPQFREAAEAAKKAAGDSKNHLLGLTPEGGRK